MIPKIIILALICVLCVPLASQQSKPVVVVMEPVASSTNITNMNMSQVRGAMEDFLTRSRNYRVVDRKRADQVLAELNLQRAGFMIDPATAKAIGRHLAADFVCVSELIKDEGYTNINISLINVETGVLEKSGSETVQGDSPADIRAATERIASRISGAMTNEQISERSALRKNVSFGLYVNVGIPVGDFGGVEYPATPGFPVPQTEGYDAGLGARFTMSIPLISNNLGFRAAAGFAYNGGTNTAPGYRDEGMSYLAMGVSGELQFFFYESYRHRGTYLFGGAMVNNETFNRSVSGFTKRKIRMGATAGLGHTFPAKSGRGGWTLELAYHGTLSAKDTGIGEPVAADYVRLSAGFVF